MQFKKCVFALLSVGLCSSVFATETVTPTTQPNPTDQYTAETSIAITPTTQRDPYEKYNRGMTKINDAIDRAILKPIAYLYMKLTPKPLAKGISNFYMNIDTVPTVLNDVLQGN